jgi:hypothetical protein
LNNAVYSQQLNILHNNIGIYRKHVLVWEQRFIYGAAIISGYIAASGTAGECVIGTDFKRSGRSLNKDVSWHLHGVIDETHEPQP